MERFHLYNAEAFVASFTHNRTLMGDTYSDIEISVPEQLSIRLRDNCTNESFRDWIDRRSGYSNAGRATNANYRDNSGVYLDVILRDRPG